MSRREFTKLLLSCYGFTVKELKAYQEACTKIQDETSTIWHVIAKHKKGDIIDFKEKTFEVFIKNLIKEHLQKYKIKK